MGVGPPSAFYVFIDTKRLLSECAGIALVGLALLFILSRIRTEGAEHVRLGPRLVTAAVTGFMAEALILFAALRTWASPDHQSSWADRTIRSTQEPGWHLASYITGLLRPGFEEGVGYFLLILFLVQEFVYGLAAYVVFTGILNRKGTTSRDYT